MKPNLGPAPESFGYPDQRKKPMLGPAEDKYGYPAEFAPATPKKPEPPKSEPPREGFFIILGYSFF